MAANGSALFVAKCWNVRAHGELGVTISTIAMALYRIIRHCVEAQQHADLLLSSRWQPVACKQFLRGETASTFTRLD